MDWFAAGRGIRQGDPISPYIFVLCIERLRHLIKNAVTAREWRTIRLSSYGPELSHLLFADDLILFAEASMEQLNVIRNCLNLFMRCSG